MIASLCLHALLGVMSAQVPFVLAVGVNHPARADLPPLRYADDDAAAAAELFGATPERTFLLSTMDDDTQEHFPELSKRARPATLAQLQAAVTQLAAAVHRAREAGEQPVVLVWLVGHGAFTKDGQPFVALEDAELTPLALHRDILLPLTDAHRVHVVMDACHAGAMVQWRASVEPTSEADVNQAAFVGTLQRPANVGFISAAAAHQRTFEWDEMRAGIFSALTRAALRGAANANGDGCVTYDEVAAYVSSALQGIGVPEARPQVITHAPAVERNAPLACEGWFLPRNTFKADLASLGSFHVEDSRGVWLTGGRFERGHDASLWLPASGSLTLRTDRGEWPLEQLQDGTLHQSAQPVVEGAHARGAVERAIKEGLFKVAYGPAYLHGFVAARPSEDTAPHVSAPPRSRQWWKAALAVPALLVTTGSAMGAGVFVALAAWQTVLYAQTDLQRPAAEARLLATGGYGAALTAGVLALAGVAAAVAAVTWWYLT